MAIILAKLDRNMPSKASNQPNILNGKTVVIVDDSAVQRKKLRELYTALGFKIVGEAKDGLDALTVTDQTQPDLISLDVIMPVMHGLETVGYLRKNGFKGSIILVSTIGAMEALAEVQAQGGYTPDAIFSKKDTHDSFQNLLSEIFSSTLSQRA